jgi:hypothetical protein
VVDCDYRKSARQRAACGRGAYNQATLVAAVFAGIPTLMQTCFELREDIVDRRHFLSASLAASAAALVNESGAQTPAAQSREYYQLRRYQLQSGAQPKLVESYFADALIPALGRMRMGPVGAFKLDYGTETPALYLLMPGSSLEDLAMVDLRLAKDEVFLKAAQPFWNAPASSPAFVRVESALLAAFEGWPRLTPPPTSATKAKRIFQLRTYESPSYADHVRKVEMFHNGEFEIFVKSGARPVFFGDTLVGPRLPNLTYMLAFQNMQELEASWVAFSGNPDWKKLQNSPRYNYESIVSNITNLILSPLEASQI